jgi:23S rRNA (cytidine2498-2'-O)-methyltransferase
VIFDTAFTVYLAAPGFVPEVLAELGEAGTTAVVRDRLVFAPGEPRPCAWAQNIWLAPRVLEIASINDAVRQLKAIQRNWVCYPVDHFRRCALIQEGLPRVSAKPQVFGQPAPTAPLGSWTLWDEHTLIASPVCSSPFPHGEVTFVEDKSGPPNRAYLKLWELFTLTGVHPGPGDLCLDLGASPGGWSWVLARLGARVFAVDKAPLDPAVAGLANVESCRGSGFSLDPEDVGRADWLFSDMACYPERLFALIARWREAKACVNFVCTLKFQGTTDQATAAAFAAIPGARLLHLWHNKHELTWFCQTS